MSINHYFDTDHIKRSIFLFAFLMILQIITAYVQNNFLWLHMVGISAAGSLFSYFLYKRFRERNLYQKAQKFNQLIMDTLPIAILVKDDQYRIVEANKYFLSMYPENQRDKIIGYTTVEEFDDEEANAFLSEDKKAFDFGYSKKIETMNFPDGQERTLSTHKIRFEDNNQTPFILITAIDISEHIAVQNDLEKSQAFLRMVMDHFPGLVFVKDESSRIIYANDRFKSMYPENMQDNIIGKTTLDLYPENQQEELLNMDREAFRKGKLETVKKINYPNGQTLDVTIKKTCVADSKGGQYLVCLAFENHNQTE